MFQKLVFALALSALALPWHRAQAQSFRPSLASLLRAERKASFEGRRILQKGREIALTRYEVIAGSCWDFADAVYSRAGFDSEGRRSVYHGSKKKPLKDLSLIQGGDWLCYINHSYGGAEHSAIFVSWLDFPSRRALMLSYAGQNRRAPARYLAYDLSDVYAVIRPAS